MLIGSGCFNPDSSPVPTLPGAPSFGNCFLCGKFDANLYDADLFIDAFDYLFALYEKADPADNSGEELFQRIQDDWQIFIIDNQDTNLRTKAFLNYILGKIASFDNCEVRVVPSVDRNLVSEWDTFAKHMTEKYRFFFNSGAIKFNEGFFSELINNQLVTLKEGQIFKRARILESQNFYVLNDMWPPAPAISKAGRANSVGIPYLYLSSSENTSIKEVRASQFSRVCVATFKLNSECKVLNLSSEAPLNPFLDNPPDLDLIDEYGARPANVLSYQTMLVALRNGLQEPLKAGESESKYVPFQFFSEFVRVTGLDGIQYKSSYDPSGLNYVFFEKDKFVIDPNLTFYELTKTEIDFKEVLIP